MEPVNEISIDGFQVVSGDFFTKTTRIAAPTFTIWDGCIGFSKQDLIMLNSCENIIIQINTADRKILITPTTSKDKDAITWLKRTNPLEAKKISCAKLTDKLYEAWGWDKHFVYRAIGKLVSSGTKVMLYFDFSSPETWKRPEAKDV